MTTPVPHKHAAKIKQWADAPDWWDVYMRPIGTGTWSIPMAITWHKDFEYDLRKSAKHPDNLKPKKRLIDWSTMPKGTMTNFGELRRHVKNQILFMTDAPNYCYKYSADGEIRLAEQTKPTYWEGGECPVPEGVVVEVRFRDGDKEQDLPSNFRWDHIKSDGDIIGYRIIGLADGWTDNPAEAV
jgi:hypothetical protein